MLTLKTSDVTVKTMQYTKIFYIVLCVYRIINNGSAIRTFSLQPNCPEGEAKPTQILLNSFTVRSKLECTVRCSTEESCSSSRMLSDGDGVKTCVLENDDYDVCTTVAAVTGRQYHKTRRDSCFNGGTLLLNSCTCSPQYTGTSCEVDINVPNECDSMPCQNGGSCIDKWKSFDCVCPPNVIGTLCQTDLCPASLCSNYCQNSGTCSCSMGTLSCHCIAGFTGPQCNTDSGPVQDVKLTVGGGFWSASWGSMELCDTGTYAYGFNQRVDHSTSDEVAICEVRLYCKNPFSGIQSNNVPNSAYADTDWGSWEGGIYCLTANYWIVQFRVYYEPSCGSCDDSSTNNIEVKCRGPGLHGTNTETVRGSGTYFSSSWGAWSAECPIGKAVCGIRTKVEGSQGWLGDDTALGDIEMQCCDF